MNLQPCKTFVIRTPDTSRENWKAINAALRHNGFEVHRFHAVLSDRGMAIVADACHPSGEEESCARRALTALPASLYMLH